MATHFSLVDHEVGDTSEYSGNASSGATASTSVTTGAAIAGTYGLLASANNASDSSNYNTRYMSYSDAAVVYVQFRFRWDTWTQGGYNSAVSKGPLMISKSTSSFNKMAWLRVSGTRQLALGYTPGSGSDVAVGSSSFTFTEDTDYWIRFLLDRTNSGTTGAVITWWTSTDGTTFTQRGTVTASTTGSNGVNQSVADTQYCHVGICHIGGFERMQYIWHIDALSAATATGDLEDEGAGGGGISIPVVMAHRRMIGIS